MKAVKTMMASTVALSMLLPSPSEASESHERSWGLSAPERLGIALGLGFSKRMDEPPDFPIDAAYGGLLRVGAEVAFGRRLTAGLSYEWRGLGRERSPLLSTGALDIERHLNALWGTVRVHPVRGDVFGGFVGLRLGPAWQGLRLSGTAWPSTDPGRSVTLRCSASGSAAWAVGADLGLEARLTHRARFVTSAGFSSVALSDDVLDGCAPGAGSVLSTHLQGGVAFDFDLMTAHE